MKIGNIEGMIINDIGLKNKIIDYLFSKLNLSNYRYTLLKNINQLYTLKSNEHYVSPNYKGYNFIAVFLKVGVKNHCVLIDKRKMSYHREKLNIKNLNIFKINIKTNNNIFKGTILDTKMIKNKKTGKYILLIKDSYVCMNNSLSDMDLKQKMIHLDNLVNNYFEGNYCENFTFCINKLFTYQDLDHIINNLIKKIDYDIIGLIFFTKKSGHSIIYIDNNTNKETINTHNNPSIVLKKPITITEHYDKTHDIIINYENFLNNREYSYETDGEKKCLWIKKNIYPDVYDLYEKKDLNRLGIACIPNLKISHYCKKYVTSECRKIICIYNSTFNKWIPLELIES